MDTKAIAEQTRLMNAATDYKAWYAYALGLDVLEGMESWKGHPASHYYQYEMLQNRLINLQTLRKAGDWGQLIYNLREGLHRNLSNLSNPDLYKHTYVGTKYLIDDYITEVVSLLNTICDNDIPELPQNEKILFFKQTGQSFGRSALLLSGGANIGLFHMGVIKALHEQKLLPRVISGSSAGSIATALIGTHTDHELTTLFDPNTLDLDTWRWLSPREMLKQKSLMDNRQLEHAIRKNVGEYTFEEAFKRSKRIINITVSPVARNQMPRLLNYLTTPHLMVWSAALASCAVPGLFPPVTLMTKDRSGVEKPYMSSIKWVDGTLQSDLPTQRLSELYNVNHHIVSQTNPHVLPFVSDQSRKERFGGFVLSLVKKEIQYRSKQILQLASYGIEPGMAKTLLDGTQALVEQHYYGDVTIHPKMQMMDYLHILSHVSEYEFRQWLLAGERATWPKVAAIRDQTIIGQTLEDCIQRLKRQARRRKEDSPLSTPAVPAEA